MSDYSVFIVDDHPVFRQGLIALVEQQPDFSVIGEAAGGTDAFNLLQKQMPDVLIVDLTLAEGSGLQLIRMVRGHDTNVKILVASMHDDAIYAERALRAGANGYINKEQAASRIIDAIRDILNGRVYLAEEIGNRLLQRKLHGEKVYRDQPEELLSDRELEVFKMIGNGLSSKKIAKQLYVSPKTVDSHREHIKKKLGIDDNIALIQRAVAWTFREAESKI